MTIHNFADQMNWEDFHYALAIAKKGSFIKASETLNVHHTTVSRRLDRLEKNLSIQLFYRHTRGVELTEAGKDMLKTLSLIQDDLSELSSKLKGYESKIKGTLRITTLESTYKFLMPYFYQFKELYPLISFDFIIEERGLNLSQGEADIAFRAGKPSSEDTIIPIKLSEFYLALYGSEKYFKNNHKPNKISDLNNHKYILTKNPPKSFIWQHWLEKHIDKNNIIFMVNKHHTTIDPIREGFGLGFLTCHQANLYDDLKLAWSSQDNWKANLWLLVQRDRYRAAKVQAFVKFIKKVIDEDLRNKMIFRE